MSDFTPTSEDIRYSYATDKRDEPGFDRWLEQFGNSERLTERERIIKLLEDRNWHYYYNWQTTPESVRGNVEGIREAIALIKGEEA